MILTVLCIHDILGLCGGLSCELAVYVVMLRGNPILPSAYSAESHRAARGYEALHVGGHPLPWARSGIYIWVRGYSFLIAAILLEHLPRGFACVRSGIFFASQFCTVALDFGDLFPFCYFTSLLSHFIF